MKTKGRRQSANVEDVQGTYANRFSSAQAAQSSDTLNKIYSQTSPTPDSMSAQVGYNSMGKAAARDRMKNQFSAHRTRWAGEQPPAPAVQERSRMRSVILEKMGKPTSDGVTKDRLK